MRPQTSPHKGCKMRPKTSPHKGLKNRVEAIYQGDGNR
jgi:hypothetical protein